MHVFVSSDREAARQLLDKKVHIRNLELKYSETRFRRISERQPGHWIQCHASGCLAGFKADQQPFNICGLSAFGT